MRNFKRTCVTDLHYSTPVISHLTVAQYSIGSPLLSIQLLSLGTHRQYSKLPRIAVLDHPSYPSRATSGVTLRGREAGWTQTSGGIESVTDDDMYGACLSSCYSLLRQCDLQQGLRGNPKHLGSIEALTTRSFTNPRWLLCPLRKQFH